MIGLRPIWLLFASVALLGTIVRPAAQEALSPDILQILSPSEGAYVVGPTPLRARVESRTSAVNVVFYVDGRQVCSLTRAPFECDWDAGATVDEHQVRVVATFAGGRRAVQNARTKGLAYTESVDVDVVQVTATVTDGRGRYVKGLPQSAFHIYEDSRPQAISHFASENVPVDLLVALDTSSSMTPAMPELKQAAKAFLASVPSKDRVTVLAFNSAIFTVTRETSDPAERANAVDRLAAWGATALYDVIVRGVEMLGHRSGRKALIVFTDGEDQGSRATIQEVEGRLQASDVPLYMIGQGRGAALEPLKRVMLRLSQPTGGRVLTAQKIDELHEAFSEVLDELSNQYLIGYSPTTLKHDDTLRCIKVDVDGRYSVRARESYRASRSTTR
jgi:Ca-activated chloride channel family protein